MPDPQIDPSVIDQTRREIGRLVSEIEQLANQERPAGEFYAEVMRRVYAALAARAVALWMRTSQGNLQLQYQVNLPQLGELNESTRPAHDELLRYSVTKEEPTIVAPLSGPGSIDAPVGIQNPTTLLLVLAPIIIDSETLGVVEVFFDANRRPSAQQGYTQFLKRIAGEVGKFIKNGRYRLILNQQAQWNQIETFIRNVHGGLNPKQVAYLVANEGKRLVQCERLTVAIRRGKKTKITAISGQDVVEQRANLVRRMTTLADRVLRHGENFVYHGRIEEHWPADVQDALKEYLDESGSKLIVMVPMQDTREFSDRRDRGDTCLICEMIEDTSPPDEMAAKVDVIARHSSIALANALEHDDIFLLPLWRVLGKSTRWMRGRGLPKVVIASAILVGVTLFLTFFPWPLRLEGRGKFVPETRRTVYAPVSGIVEQVSVRHGDATERGSTLARMSSFELDRQRDEILANIQDKQIEIRSLEQSKTRGAELDPEVNGKITQANLEIRKLENQLKKITAEIKKLDVNSPIRGTVMDWKPELLLTRPVEKGDPLFEVAQVEGKWIIEADFPENAITHITRAQKQSEEPLSVDIIFTSSPDKHYKGRLLEYATQAQTLEQQNMVHAKVGIDGDNNLIQHLRDVSSAPETAVVGDDGRKVSGIEAKAKVNCGDHALGYVLFRELIDFFREYVFF